MASTAQPLSTTNKFETEMFLLQKLNQQMEERIDEQKLLIDLLQTKAPTDSNHHRLENNPVLAQKPVSTSTTSLPEKPAVVEQLPAAMHHSGVPAASSLKNRDKQRNRGFLRGTAEIPAVPVGNVQSQSRSVATFAAVARRAYLYVGNVSLQATEGGIVEYLQEVSSETLYNRTLANAR